MTNALQNDSAVSELVLSTGVLDLIKEGIQQNKENIPSTHIDSMLCLSNLMNIKDIAVNP